MAKKFLIHLLCCVFVAVVAFVSIFPFGGVSTTDGSNWMSKLDDNTRIKSLSIPGSHNSGALHSIADVSGKNQSLSIKDQLAIGVRFLDLRLRLKNDNLIVVHDFVDQNDTFDNVLSTLSQFVTDNDSEFLFISIKEDDKQTGSTKSFNSAVKEAVSKYSVIKTQTYIPSLVETARGNVYMLSRYDDSEQGVEMYDKWKDNESFRYSYTAYIQDYYRISDIDSKKEAIKACFDESAKETYLTLNFTSCYLENGFPPIHAITTAKSINNWLLEIIPSIDGSLGIVIVDFITSKLSTAIYGRNFA